MSQFIEMFENKGYDTKELRTLIVKSFPGEWGVDDNDGSGVKVIRTTNITNEDKLELSEVVVRSIAQPKLDKKKLVKGDILLERSGGTKDYPVGRVAYFESEDIYVVNNFTQTLRCTNRVESKYLFYFLFFYYKLNKMKIRSMGNQTTGIQNLNMDEYMQIPVIIPPIEAQKQFLHIVEQADKSKFIGFKSQFIEMSGDWGRHKLDSFIDIVRGVSYKPTDVVDSNNPCATGILRANNISDGELNTVEMVYVNNERVSEIQKLRPKDIVMCASSGSQYLVGKAAINKHLHSNYAHGAFCLLIRCKELLMPEFLNLYLQTDDYRGQIEEKSCGSNILNIKQSDITSLIIPIPNFAVQQNFVTILKQADKSKYIN